MLIEHSRSPGILIVILCTAILLSTPIFAQQSPGMLEAPHVEWVHSAKPALNPDGISGTLVIVGGGGVPRVALEVLQNEIDNDQSIVVLTAASGDRASAGANAKAMLEKAGISNVVIAAESDDAEAECDLITQQLSEATGVWICGGQQSRLAKRYGQTPVETALIELLQRGGIVAGTSAGAAIMSKVMIASGGQQPNMGQGFDLLPGSIIDQHFTERNRLGRSRIAVSQNPGLVGIGIDESTAIVVRGRTIRVVGKGSATFTLGRSDYRNADELKVDSGGIADWIQLRRAAKQRATKVDPGNPRYGKPQVEKGSLVIVGGGGLPASIVDRFLSLAGGKQAHIVYLPTAVPSRLAQQADIPRFLADADVASVTCLPQMGSEDVDSDAFRTTLEKATGVWFGGGRQWNFVDAYDGTQAVRLFHEVLQRGGVIGGSSAGATIQGEFLVRGHPLGNTVMMAEGYERGFAFLPGVAIDQHFTQRRRQPDLLPVIKQHPNLLGIGIDEATALVVQGSHVEVLGKNSVHFMTADRVENGEYFSLQSGENAELPAILHQQNVVDLVKDPKP